MIYKSVFRQTALLFGFSLSVAMNGYSATTYDPAASFEQGYLSHSNPNGVWSYGYSTSPTGPVSLYTQTSQSGVDGDVNEQFWTSSSNLTGTSAVRFNNGPAFSNGNVDYPANQLLLVPFAGQNADLVFTAPTAGTYSVVASFRGDQNGIGVVVGVVANGSLLLSSGISADAQIVPFTQTVSLSAGNTVVFFSANAGGNQITGLTLSITGPLVTQVPYYFSQLAVGGGFQTTLTYVNYSPQQITCVTNFYSDIGSPLSIQFSQGSVSTRTDTLQAGQSIHDQTTGSPPAVMQGWAQATCTGPIQASVLYRLYQAGAPVSEASVNAETAPTTAFATFAQAAAQGSTGVAYANPSTTQSASITVTAYDSGGNRLGSQSIVLGPLAHGSANLGPLLGIQSFTGFVKITSTLPILSLSLNAEAFPVFSSLPPGDLPGSTLLVTP